MFESSGWFALGADNRRLPGLVLVSLADGLARVGRGEVATIVGRLKPGFLVVDVDVDDEVRGVAITDVLARWAARAQVWALVRPTGGAPGRHHVFVAAGDARTAEALTAEVARLRAAFDVSAKAVDVRRAVRPLSAPHRSGAWTAPYGSPSAAVRDLTRARRRAGASRPGRIGGPPRRRRAADPPTAAGGELRDASGTLYGPTAQRYLASGPPTGQHRGPSPGRPLTPWQPRVRRELPPVWAAYLATGTVPPLGGNDHSRTTAEARATAELLRAGHDAASAWAAITAADPEAMTRSRADHRRWIRWVWNRAVWDDHAYHRRAGRPAAAPAPCPGQVLAAIVAARDALTAAARAVPPRRRAALLLVGHTVLDRMQRRHTLRTPVPERDLHVDTGLDRGTIRAALRMLDGAVGRLHRDTLDRSPAGRATTSFEFEIPPAEGGVSLLPPPSLHTPEPALPHPALWATLPPASHPLWRHLAHSPGPLTERQLTQEALPSCDPTTEPSPRQLRTTRHGLRALAAAGLAVCGVDGGWTAAGAGAPAPALQAARRQRAQRHNRVSEERTAYRRGAHSSWATQRAAALSGNYARERAWWAGLAVSERQARSARWVRLYEGLSVVDQARVKASLAQRRRRAGVDEARRHAEWITGHPPVEFERRSISRAHWFRSVAKPLQQAHAAAWRAHRERFGIPVGLPQSLPELHVRALPDTAGVRDEQHLQADVWMLEPFDASEGAAAG